MRLRRFRDRAEAGRLLADEVEARLGAGEPIDAPLVLGLPRGGVPVAAPVAERLGGELDVLTVRKIGAPYHHELAIGAVASGGLIVLNDQVIYHLGITDDDVAHRTDIARHELAEREHRLRGDRERPSPAGRTVIIVDDGLATGATMRAAVQAVRTAEPQRLVVAVPVGPPDACAEVAELADELVCLLQPPSFGAVGEWYADFSATTDDDVLRLLAAAAG